MDLPYDSGAVRSPALRQMTARTRRTLWVLCAVAVAIAIAGAFQPLLTTWRTMRIREALTRLLEEQAPETPVRSRIVGARSPQLGQTRSSNSGSSASLAVHAAVGRLVDRATAIDSADALHASGIAHYYVGKFAIAARDLERTAAESGRPEHWSDLAAARLEASIAASAPHELVGALVAVNRALTIDPQLPAALYNRAAIIERLGLREHALRAWRLALVAEADPVWQESIREHVRGTAPASDDEQWERIVARLEHAPEADFAGAEETTGLFAQQARLAAETSLPNDWGMAMVAGDAETANRKLQLARTLAAAVRRQSGESLAAESIALIDAAIASRDGRVAKLADAYVLYRQGRLLYSAHDLKRAEETLRQAGRAFEVLGSPMVKAARYYAANAVADQNRVQDAAALNAALLREVRQAGPRHRALAASASWQAARYEGEMGHWDAALRAAADALADFRALGEKENAGAMESMLAELYDHLGQPNRAWEHRVPAFELLSEAGEAYRLQVALAAASRDRIRQEDWPAAIALLDLEIALSRSDRGADISADGLARRARAHAANGSPAAARSDIVLGRAVGGSVPDASLRTHLEAIFDAAEGVIERNVDPRRSVRLLGNAIDFHQRAAREILLPELFLERGRSHLAMGAESAALADFDAGIRQLERQRTRLADFELSSTIGDAGDDLFAQAVRIAARQGNVLRAYDYSERSRGRALAQQLSNGPPLSARAEPGVGIVEYMVLREQVIAFTVADEVRMIVIPIARAELERSVRTLTSAIISGRPIEEIRDAGSVLQDQLIRPLGPHVTRNATTVFVANKILQRVPWAVLYDRDRGRYLIEDTMPLTAPSVTLASRSHANGRAVPSSALVAGNPRASSTVVDLPRLPAAEQEARKIASYYQASRLLLGAEASKGLFVREAGLHDVLHFAGHAVSSEVSHDQSFLVLAPDGPGDSGLLYSRDIARLPLRNVRLVVLAACGTLRGTTVHLDGMPSIARAFLAAGTGAVIGTLWDVDDSYSVDLFTRIHRAVANGTPVAEAVRDAQIGALRSGNGGIAHPKTWAGLTLIDGLEVQP